MVEVVDEAIETEAVDNMQPLRIHFKGEVGDNQSWGISTIGNVQGFLAQNCSVVLEATQKYGNIPKEVDYCANLRWNATPDVYIRQGLAKHMDELQHVDSAIKRISLSCWDSSLVDEKTAEFHNKYADGVFALSSFTRDAFRNAGVKVPIHIGGQGFDETLFYPAEEKDSEEFVFITVAVAQGRKGTHTLIKAFEKSLGNVKGAKLIIKSNSWGSLKDYGTKVNNIEKIYREYSREDLADLYRESDCFVLPTEGDSFALPGIEAMACGLPLVITDFGGPCDYCTYNTGYPVKHKLKEAGYLPGHQASPDEDDLADNLYHVFHSQKEAKERGMFGAKVAHSRWTWKHDAIRNVKFLRKLKESK